jgi:ribonuclease HI
MVDKLKYYVVWKGRMPGIYISWQTCSAQVQGYPGARYKSFPTHAAALRAFRAGAGAHAGKPATQGDWLFSPSPPLAKSLVVDAACSGSPGLLEFRGLELDSGRQVFHRGPYRNGTNNVGEFLAIVQALQLLEKNGSDRPVYSDSSTAIAWVKRGRCKTSLVKDETNSQLFTLIRQAETWLAGQNSAGRVLKWDTSAWGENPSDFNRK